MPRLLATLDLRKSMQDSVLSALWKSSPYPNPLDAVISGTVDYSPDSSSSLLTTMQDCWRDDRDILSGPVSQILKLFKDSQRVLTRESGARRQIFSKRILSLNNFCWYHRKFLLYIKTAQKLKGSDRQFMAEVVKTLGIGWQTFADRELGLESANNRTKTSNVIHRFELQFHQHFHSVVDV
jgi:hypothetical protein